MTMHYGGDYNPEQWPEAVWHDDVRLVREAGVTMVSLGIFAWSRIQPAEGVFDFEWLDTVIDLLHEGGIAVDLATATASPPPWATEAYPQMLPRDENGAVYWPGSRQHFAPASTEYRRLASDGHDRRVASYALCLGFRIRYVLDLNAREAMQLIELRSGREGHPSYRAVAQEMHRQIAAVHPSVAATMTHVDTTAEPRLERILSEMRTQAKLDGLRAP